MLQLKSIIACGMLATCLGLTCELPMALAQNSALANQDISVEDLVAEIQAIAAMDLETLIKELDTTWKEYEKQVQAVLRTRLKEEKEFVARVILLVQKERIPKNLVDSAWLWVRNNRPGTNYPFVYFEKVLRLQAEKAKVVLPAFDRAIYDDRNAMRNRRLQDRIRRR